MAQKPRLRLGSIWLRLGTIVGRALVEGAGSPQAQLRLRPRLVRENHRKSMLAVTYTMSCTNTSVGAAELEASRSFPDAVSYCLG